MNILAIGAHPDDIEFGCGGTLIKYAKGGHNISLFVLTDGSFGGDPEIRKNEQKQAADFIGAKGLFWANYRDTELICNRELILKIEEVVQKVSPDVVFLNFWADVHQDHRAASLRRDHNRKGPVFCPKETRPHCAGGRGESTQHFHEPGDTPGDTGGPSQECGRKHP